MECSGNLQQLKSLMRPGNLILIAGRPGLGKSYLACDLLSSSKIHGMGAYVSIGRSRESINRRFAEIGKNPSLIFDEGEDSLESALRMIGTLGVPVSGLVFDSIASGDHERASAQIAELKSLAARFKAPVIALADISRLVDQRKDKKPQLRDLPTFELLHLIDSLVLLYSDAYYAGEPVKEVEVNVPKSPVGAFSFVCRWESARQED